MKYIEASKFGGPEVLTVVEAQTPTPTDATTDQAQPHHEPAFEQIQVRAYEIYVQRGRQDGLDRDDWFQAEKELKTSGHNRSR